MLWITEEESFISVTQDFPPKVFRAGTGTKITHTHTHTERERERERERDYSTTEHFCFI